MLRFPCLIVLLAGSLAAAEPRDGLVLEYRFEGDARDTSGGGHDGKLVGTPVYEAGRAGKCLTFSGVGQYVDSGITLADLREEFTVECWVKPASTQNAYADILGNHAGGGPSGFALQQDGTTTNSFGFGYGTGGGYTGAGGIRLAPGRWQHVAIAKTKETLTVYLNGLPVASTRSGGPMVASTTTFRVALGIAEASRCFRGSIDEVRVWSRARTRFDLDLTPEERLEAFAQAARLEATLSVPAGVFRPGERPSLALRLDPAVVPAGFDHIRVDLEAAEIFRKEPVLLAPVILERSAAFAARADLPGAPGYYELAVRPALAGEGPERRLQETRLSFAVLPGRPGAASTATASSASPPAALPAGAFPSTTVVSLDGDWLIAADAANRGREEGWAAKPAKDARKARVPGIIQEAFPAYHGVAWYWREIAVPAPAIPGGRFLLRFGAVDYLADVFVNGKRAGGHEGGETPFTVDITDAAKPGAPNLLAVRVLNPKNEPIDGIALGQTPHRNKTIPYGNGSSYDYGGIVEGVELIAAPPVRISDLAVRTDPRTGEAIVDAEVTNASGAPALLRIQAAVAPAASGETLAAALLEHPAPAGRSRISAALRIPAHRLWNLEEPFLYRAQVRIVPEGRGWLDERSVRFGFRDFRVERGFFRLNGKRLFLKSTHTGNHCPVGQVVPPREVPDLLRRDLLLAKTSGFNCVRFISGVAHPDELDFCDELGLLVYEESLAGWCLGDSPRMAERFDLSTAEMILRDRNHPSVAIWGLLNETDDGPVFRHAVESLKLVRYLDDSRLVLLGSGRWDGRYEIGSVSNPGSREWERVWGAEREGYDEAVRWGSGGYRVGAGDAHVYPGTPHTSDECAIFRSLGRGTKPVFLSEGGIGSLLDAIRELRRYEQAGLDPAAEDAVLMRNMAETFAAEWKRLGFDGVYAFPEEMLAESQRLHGRQRLLVFDLVRSNPRICGYNLTGMLDHGMTGEGAWRFFREWKPGMADVLEDGWAPVRWCLFVEPMNGYSGRPFRIEVVLANEDVLAPGEYPVTVRAVGPAGVAWEKKTKAVIPRPAAGEDGPLAVPVLLEEVALSGPPGDYEVAVYLEKGGAPAGGRLRIHLDDPSTLPRLDVEVRAAGLDGKARDLLSGRGVRILPLDAAPAAHREVLLIGAGAGTPGDAAAWRALLGRVASGSAAVFLSPDIFRREGDSTAWLPLAKKGRCYSFGDWLYHKECVAARHPIFEGLRAPGILDWDFYGPTISHPLFDGQDTPDEVAAGAFALGYPCPGGAASGVMVGAYRFGAGWILLNTLRVAESAGHPAADRLLLNFVRWAAGKAAGDPVPLPANFEAKLDSLGIK